MVPLVFALKTTLVSFAFFQPPPSPPLRHQLPSSDFLTQSNVVVYQSISNEIPEEESEYSTRHNNESANDQENFSKLCKSLKVGPPTSASSNDESPHLLRLETNDAGVRGMYPNSNLKEGDIILSIPLSSCLRDDEPPSWLSFGTEEEEDDIVQWPTKLAASLIDLQLREKGKRIAKDKGNKVDDDDKEENGKSIWLSMLPDPNLLRASLPMHWSEDLISSTKSVGLEMSVDKVYFSRARSIPDLMSSIRSSGMDGAENFTEEQLERLCQDAYDVVQTRCCSVNQPSVAKGDDGDKVLPLRLVAPVFDFLNHGTGCFPYDKNSPNAIYESKIDDTNGRSYLVVSATKDIGTNDEVLIDYGEYARTAWECLGSYGFVPCYESNNERNAAELFMDGVRCKVGGDNVPFELIEAACNALEIEMDEYSLPSAVALRIAERAFEFADELSLMNEQSTTATTSVNENQGDKYSMALASSLRQHQSKVLRQWAFGLKEYVADQCMEQY